MNHLDGAGLGSLERSKKAPLGGVELGEALRKPQFDAGILCSLLQDCMDAARTHGQACGPDTKTDELVEK